MEVTSKGFKKPAENEYYSIEDANDNAQLTNDLFEGVDSAIGQKADKTQISNPNLLINGDFQVWQRGTSFTSEFVAGIYTADRWRVFGNADSSIKVEKVADGMKITALTNGAVALITHKFETYLRTFLNGKKVTFSAEIDGVVYGNIKIQ